jgi:hypothetical protein
MLPVSMSWFHMRVNWSSVRSSRLRRKRRRAFHSGSQARPRRPRRVAVVHQVEHPVGELDDVEVVDDDLGVGEAGSDGGAIAGGHVDGHESDLLVPRLWSAGQPVQHVGGGASNRQDLWMVRG